MLLTIGSKDMLSQNIIQENTILKENVMVCISRRRYVWILICLMGCVKMIEKGPQCSICIITHSHIYLFDGYGFNKPTVCGCGKTMEGTMPMEKNINCVCNTTLIVNMLYKLYELTKNGLFVLYVSHVDNDEHLRASW